jgi:hypothetical protein
MSGTSKGPGAECRSRVLWSPRGRRRWCPGVSRVAEAASGRAATGWTAFLQWQAVFDALRGRRAQEALGSQPTTEAQVQPRAALPDRRRRVHDAAPPLDGWLERTGDTTSRPE